MDEPPAKKAAVSKNEPPAKEPAATLAMEGDFVKLKEHEWIVGKVYKTETLGSWAFWRGSGVPEVYSGFDNGRTHHWPECPTLVCHLLIDKVFAPGSLKGAGIMDIGEPFALDSVVKITLAEHDLAVRAFREKMALRCAALAGDAESWRLLGASSVAAFRPLMERVSCPYARSSQLLGSPEWDWALSVDTNILQCVPNLRRLANSNKSVDEPPERLDGLVMEVPIRSLGIPSSAHALPEATAAVAFSRTHFGCVDLACSYGEFICGRASRPSRRTSTHCPLRR
jgi:hypothetical protein